MSFKLQFIKEKNKHEKYTNYYIWKSVGDSKTRSSHAERDGKVFSWDNPPEGGHPGEAYNCRCKAEPYEPPKDINDEVSKYDKLLYGLASASQGYSLGFSDEVEGVINGAGNVIAKGLDKGYTKLQPYLSAKYPRLPKNIYYPEKSYAEAFKHGYKTQRDERREHLEEGKEKAPYLTAITEATGTITSPARILKARKFAPPKVVSRINLIDAALTGSVYGIGSAEGDWKSHTINAGIGMIGGLAGNKAHQKLDRVFSRGIASQSVRYSLNNSIEQGTSNLIEAFIKRYNKDEKD